MRNSEKDISDQVNRVTQIIETLFIFILIYFTGVDTLYAEITYFDWGLIFPVFIAIAALLSDAISIIKGVKTRYVDVLMAQVRDKKTVFLTRFTIYIALPIVGAILAPIFLGRHLSSSGSLQIFLFYISIIVPAALFINFVSDPGTTRLHVIGYIITCVIAFLLHYVYTEATISNVSLYFPIIYSWGLPVIFSLRNSKSLT